VNISCFIRLIKDLYQNPEDVNIFDFAYEYQHLFGSIIDFFNGLSILYAFKCIADATREKRRKMTSNEVVNTSHNNLRPNYTTT
jgi:hypothetical protein